MNKNWIRNKVSHIFQLKTIKIGLEMCLNFTLPGVALTDLSESTASGAFEVASGNYKV